jgi:hypothetical protein
MAALTGRCPGCGNTVPLLRPRPATGRFPHPRPWRRKDHAIRGDLGAPGAVRCRYPGTLSSPEIPTEDP